MRTRSSLNYMRKMRVALCESRLSSGNGHAVLIATAFPRYYAPNSQLSAPCTLLDMHMHLNSSTQEKLVLIDIVSGFGARCVSGEAVNRTDEQDRCVRRPRNLAADASPRRR